MRKKTDTAIDFLSFYDLKIEDIFEYIDNLENKNTVLDKAEDFLNVMHMMYLEDKLNAYYTKNKKRYLN
jgi:hypothetical protein